LVRSRRIRVQEPLRQPDGAEVEALVEAQALGPTDDEFGRATADVEQERLFGKVAPERGAAKGQLRLLVAREQARREAVAPLDLAEKSLAVLRVPDRTRRDKERALGSELLDRPPEVDEGIANASDRGGEEALPLVDPLAEPRDLQPTDDVVETTVTEVGDEQA